MTIDFFWVKSFPFNDKNDIKNQFCASILQQKQKLVNEGASSRQKATENRFDCLMILIKYISALSGV
jgi:hypothetical protein